MKIPHTAKELMTKAAEAAIRGDADAVEKAEAALAELERNRVESKPIDTETRAPQ